MEHTLTTPKEADVLIARMFGVDHACSLDVREEKAFKNGGWLSLGLISLDPSSLSIDQLLAAVGRGAFEWKVPDLSTARSDLANLIGLKSEEKVSPKLRRALDAIAAISVRAGLQHPKFDPDALETMPFRRSTTVVSDTSGATQGGLDFVARYLHPAARVKVPAIVQMEIVNFADRFLSARRALKTRSPDLLIDHLMSQGAQRVLLRLELRGDTEIERTFLLGDPLRSAFQHENDPDLKELNLSVSIRAYVDRLIVEAARQHQAQSNLGHRVQLLTSDQGLARMALAEGIRPLFFNSVVADDFFGKRLTGTILDPFRGQLREMPVASLLWELATAFGSARIRNTDNAHSLVVSAFGETLSWAPYQSHADLLWCDHRGVPDWPKTSGANSAENGEPRPIAGKSNTGRQRRRDAKGTAPDRNTKVLPISIQRFNVSQFIGLIDALDNNQVMSEDQIIKVVGARNRNGIDEYRRFLTSVGLVESDGRNWKGGPKTQRLAIALRNEDVADVLRVLHDAPSFDLFAKRLAALQIGEAWKPGDFERGASTYQTLGEITRLCAPVFGEGLYCTPRVHGDKEFADIALRRFHELDQGDGLVATGAWLEHLIRQEGIHPEIARLSLDRTSASNLLRRSVEGSTTDLRFDSHVIKVLRVIAGKPIVATVHLYRGDYLIPGKSSTSLHIEGTQ